MQPPTETSQASSFRDTSDDAAPRRRLAAMIRDGGVAAAPQDPQPLPPAGHDPSPLSRLASRRISQSSLAGEADPRRLAPLPQARRASDGPAEDRPFRLAAAAALAPAALGAGYAKARFRQQAVAQRVRDLAGV
jgi:hypothetical protein